ncbi:MAG: hypothetical protein QM576_00485 [Rhodopseudomonas sp.]|uniref:hypothetical protein n=1 Tax=Rhodopseudomonas sp. TaxID=1078 RepID=UPI0039E5AB02
MIGDSLRIHPPAEELGPSFGATRPEWLGCVSHLRENRAPEWLILFTAANAGEYGSFGRFGVNGRRSIDRAFRAQVAVSPPLPGLRRFGPVWHIKCFISAGPKAAGCGSASAIGPNADGISNERTA